MYGIFYFDTDEDKAWASRYYTNQLLEGSVFGRFDDLVGTIDAALEYVRENHRPHAELNIIMPGDSRYPDEFAGDGDVFEFTGKGMRTWTTPRWMKGPWVIKQLKLVR